MKLRCFFLLHLAMLLVGIIALWWFVYPDLPEAAVGDGLIAGSFATIVEAFAMHLQGPAP